MPRTMTVPAAIKATGADTNETSDLAEGQFRALVSVFNNVDQMGDRVVPGAFSNTLKAWDDKGDPIPVIWSHDWNNPFAHIGHVLSARETDDGLEVLGELDLEDNALATQVYRLMKGRRVTQFSFAFDVLDGGYAAKAEDAEDEDEDADVYELRELALYEVGPCLLGVNQATDLRDIKSLVAAEVKAALAVVNTAPQTPVPTGTGEPQGTSSQGAGPRDDAPGSSPDVSTPPVMTSASVLALIDTQLPEGV